MDWMSILNQCLDVILPAVASVIAILFGVLGAKIKRIYIEKTQNEAAKVVVDNVVRWVQQVYYELEGPEKLQKALTEASTILKEKGITISETELDMMIESAVYGLKKGMTTETVLVEGTVEKEEVTPESVENVEEDK